MNRDPSDTWPDEMVRLLSEDAPRPDREPNALDAAAYVGVRIAHAGAWAIILICILGFWVITP